MNHDFRFRGVHGYSRLRGWTEESTKLKTKCDIAISKGLATRRNVAIEFCAAIQQFRTENKDEGNIVQLHFDWYTFIFIGTYSKRYLQFYYIHVVCCTWDWKKGSAVTLVILFVSCYVNFIQFF